ncbi:MAG TPA: DUF3817 domain-containing protein [Pseudonocardia sp.]
MPRHPELRWLSVAAVVETVSLAVLLGNLATMHVQAVASAVGPLHGFSYLATIAVAFLIALPNRIRMLALIPGIGGLLVLRKLRAVDERPTEPDDYRSGS